MRKKHFPFLLLLLLCTQAGYATKDDFAVSHIPDSLLKNANSVVRLSEINLDVSDAGKATYRFHKIVTVLNEAGAKELEIFLFYNRLQKFTSFKASLYDREGKLMNRRSEADLNDYALHDGFSLFNDARYKHLQTSGGGYPVTIDYTYVYNYNGLLDYPDWHIQEANQSVELGNYTLAVPVQVGLKYKCRNIDLTPVLTARKGTTGYTEYAWHVQGLKAQTVPVNSYRHSYFLPQVMVTPGLFEIAGYKGSWASWKTFGDAMNTMWKDTRNLSSETIREVQKMVHGVTSDRAKAEILYSYLQHNFRYVSVQIGIGGYIPFASATVDSTRYGDCKALSNYLCALLNAAGIKSFPALINAGEDEHAIDTAFPSDKFNHAILYAQLQDGPLWLECTSNSIPFGELGVFTENRYALILSDEGGLIVKTPSANAQLNTLKAVNEVEVGNDFQANVFSTIHLGGEFRLQAKPHFVFGTEKERSHYVFNVLGLRQSDNYSFQNIIDSASEISFHLTGSPEKAYDFKTGGKTFLPASFIKSWYENVSADTSQNCDLLLGFPSVRSEELTYHLEGMSCSSLPPNFKLDNRLVEFNRQCERIENNKISIHTSLAIKKNIVAAVDIPLLKESLQTVNKYLQQKLIVDAK